MVGALSPIMAPVTNQSAIVFVESSERLRKLITGTLRTFGYQVFDHPTADDAVAFVRDHAGPLTLLLTIDVAGSLTDVELTAAIRLMRPQLAALNMIGCTRESIIAAADATTSLAFSLGPS
jgi:hypothetical protein